MSADDYHGLVHAIRSSRGHHIEWQVRAIKVSHTVYFRNQQELIHVLQNASSYPKILQSFASRNSDNVESNFIELFRLLHNFVASVKSLVDHTRRIAHGILPTTALEIYEQRKASEFTNDGVTRFLHDLRNYLLHVGQAPVSATIRFGDGTSTPTGAFELQVDELQKWDKWSSVSRTFILGQGEAVHLLETVQKYDRKIYGFYNWLLEHIRVACREPLQEFEALQESLRQLYATAGIPNRGVNFKPFSTSERRTGAS